jgi:cytoskeletal protein CcmA (bactofilin family)
MRDAYDARHIQFKNESDMTMNGSGSKNVLSSDVEINGTLKFAGELTFEGKLEGDIVSDGTLQLGDSTVINGNVNVNSVVVRGKVNGNITAKDKIEIKAKAELFGDIKASKLAIEEGVTFVGKTEVNPNKAAPSPAPAPRLGGDRAADNLRVSELSKAGGR